MAEAETVRGRVAGALADKRITLKDVWREVEQPTDPGGVSMEVSYQMIGAVARGGATGDGPKSSPKADHIRAVIARLTGKPVGWLFQLNEGSEPHGNSGTGDGSAEPLAR